MIMKEQTLDSQYNTFVIVTLFFAVDCVSSVAGVCHTFAGRMYVTGNVANSVEAEEAVLPSLQRYIQSRSTWNTIDPRILDIVYFISDGGEIVEPPPLPGTPTVAPSPATPAPTISKLRLIVAWRFLTVKTAFL
jgi:hypothetical protein